MSAMNVVRFRVKPGREEAFVEGHRTADIRFKGFRRGSIVSTGDRRYCFVGEWDSFDAIVQARPQMIALLDTFRADLEDLGGELGVSDPVSGEVVAELGAR